MNSEKEIRALWWKQPYGELMLAGKIETRTWDTKCRGIVLLCASKQPYTTSQIKAISGDLVPHLNDVNGELNGKAFAIGKLTDSRPMVKSDERKCYVEYREGLYCHVYEDVTPIVPFEMKGCQGWKKLDSEILNQIRPLHTEDYKWW